MDDAPKNTVAFEQHRKYKCGDVTYEITAHFSSENDSLKDKIQSLLKNSTLKNQ